MHATDTFKHWARCFHDGSVRFSHCAGHLLHEKNFWGVLVVVALLAGLLTLIALLGDNMTSEQFRMPYGPYEPYY